MPSTMSQKILARVSIPQYPPDVLQILNFGGLVPFMKARLQASAAAAAS